MTEISLVSTLKARMHWQQTRQKLIAENVANADTPGFRPKDLKQPGTGLQGGKLAMTQTSPSHLAGIGLSASSEDVESADRYETQPSGNGVNLETEMVKAAQNQSDYQLAASLYQKSLAMLRTASGSKS